MADLSINALYSAICELEREADFRWNTGNRYNLDRYRDLQHTIRAARAEYNALSAALPRLRDLKNAADREYDNYATRVTCDDEGSCSCHINQPCGYCTRQTDEEEA